MMAQESFPGFGPTPPTTPYGGSAAPNITTAGNDGLNWVAGSGKRPAQIAVVCAVLGFLAPILAVLGIVAATIALSRGAANAATARLATGLGVSALVFLGVRFAMGWVG